MTGLDSIAQAAGRCNREGRLVCGRVFVFEPEDGIPPGELRRAADSGRELLRDCGDNLLDLDAIERYFRLHYWKRQEEWDKYQVLACFKAPGRNLDFRTAADGFRFIRDDQMPVIIPWGDTGAELVARLRSPVPPDRETRRRIQRYIVQIPRRVWEPLVNSVIEVLHDTYPCLLNMQLYDQAIGLHLPADPSLVEPEALIL